MTRHKITLEIEDEELSQTLDKLNNWKVLNQFIYAAICNFVKQEEGKILLDFFGKTSPPAKVKGVSDKAAKQPPIVLPSTDDDISDQAIENDLTVSPRKIGIGNLLG